MNKGLVAALFAASIAVAACSSSREARERNPAPCPNIVVLEDAARMIEFEGEAALENIAYSAEITNVETACRYFADRPINAEVTIDLAFGRGPQGAAGDKVFKYFVAVTRTDLEVIAKEEFQVPIKFGERTTVVLKEEEIEKILIPRAGEQTSGLNFEIIVGFSLTPEQAVFNRSGASLKFPDLK